MRLRNIWMSATKMPDTIMQPSPPLCDCGCGRTIVLRSAAPHKRFASPACRLRWHGTQRLQAMQALDVLSRARVQAGLASDLTEGRSQVMQALRAFQARTEHGEEMQASHVPAPAGRNSS